MLVALTLQTANYTINKRRLVAQVVIYTTGAMRWFTLIIGLYKLLHGLCDLRLKSWLLTIAVLGFEVLMICD